MTEEIMPREDRMGKLLTFIGGCITGILGVFAVAVMSELSSSSMEEEGSASVVPGDEGTNLN
jgi:hypothetical protein